MFWVEFRFYDSVGFLNDLIGCVGRTCAGLADKRQGRNTQFSMRDIGLAGFSPFLMQCPSFLSHQRQICEGIGHGRSNCQTLLGMERIPSDNHIRAMLDDVEPSSLYGLFDEVLAAVERADVLPSLTSLGGHTLIAMDGTQYFASNKLSCRNCSTRRHANGQIDYFHMVVAACIVKPGKNWFCLYDNCSATIWMGRRRSGMHIDGRGGLMIVAARQQCKRYFCRDVIICRGATIRTML